MEEDRQSRRRGRYRSAKKLTRRDSERGTLFRRTSLSRRIKFDFSKRRSPEIYYDGPRSPGDRALFRNTVHRAMENVDYAIAVLSNIEKGSISKIDRNTAALIKNTFDIFDGELRMDHIRALKSSYEQIRSELNDKDFILKIESPGRSIAKGLKTLRSYFNRKDGLTVRMSDTDALHPEVGANSLIQEIARHVKLPPGLQKSSLGDAFTGALADPSNFADLAGGFRTLRETHLQAVARRKTQYKLAREIIAVQNARLSREEREERQKEISEKLRAALYEKAPPIGLNEERRIQEQVSQLGRRLSEADFERQAKAIWADEPLGKASLIENPQKHFEDRLLKLRAIGDPDKRHIEAEAIRDQLFEVYKAQRMEMAPTSALKNELDRISPPRPNHALPPVSPITEPLPVYTPQQTPAAGWNAGMAAAGPMQGNPVPVQTAALSHAQAAYWQQMAAQPDFYGSPQPAPAPLQYAVGQAPHDAQNSGYDPEMHHDHDLSYWQSSEQNDPPGQSQNNGRNVQHDHEARAAQRVSLYGE